MIDGMCRRHRDKPDDLNTRIAVVEQKPSSLRQDQLNNNFSQDFHSCSSTVSNIGVSTRHITMLIAFRTLVLKRVVFSEFTELPVLVPCT
jgi:hypothetical protein